MASRQIPTYDALINPLLRALNSLGGSGSIEEIYDKVVENEQIPEELLTILQDPEKSNQTQLAHMSLLISAQMAAKSQLFLSTNEHTR